MAEDKRRMNKIAHFLIFAASLMVLLLSACVSSGDGSKNGVVETTGKATTTENARPEPSESVASPDSATPVKSITPVTSGGKTGTTNEVTAQPEPTIPPDSLALLVTLSGGLKS